MPKAATAPTPSRSVSQCSAPVLPCPPSLGASHLPFPSAPSFTPSPVADPAAHLHSGVWRVVCFWPQRSPSPLLSANLLPRQAPPVRRWARARHRSSESPSPRQQAHLLLLTFILQDFLCRRRLCAGAWRSQPATPRSFPGTRVPPSGALTVLHELFSSLGALKPSLNPVSGSGFLCKVCCAGYRLLA